MLLSFSFFNGKNDFIKRKKTITSHPPKRERKGDSQGDAFHKDQHGKAKELGNVYKREIIEKQWRRRK